MYKILFVLLILGIINSANAKLISIDLKNKDDNLATWDTNTGLEWLDMSETKSRSYLDITSNFNTGGDFAGWRYASTKEVEILIDSAGGVGNYYNWPFTYPKNHVQDAAVADLLLDMLGRTNPLSHGSPYIAAITSDIYLAYDHALGTRVEDPNRRWAHFISTDYPTIDDSYVALNSSGSYIWWEGSINTGSFLVRKHISIPEPSAIALMGLGLLGLLGVSKRMCCLQSMRVSKGQNTYIEAQDLEI